MWKMRFTGLLGRCGYVDDLIHTYTSTCGLAVFGE